MNAKYSIKQIKAATEALRTYRERPFVKHQWEEIVLYLSHCDDQNVREKMTREIGKILEQEPGNPVFRHT